MYKVAVTGGRDYSDKRNVFRVLDEIHSERPITVLIHGDATGADTHAGYWADKRGVFQCRFPVTSHLWTKHGKAAGVLRNITMLKATMPDLLVAFPGNRGTSNCMRETSKLRIEILDHREP